MERLCQLAQSPCTAKRRHGPIFTDKNIQVVAEQKDPTGAGEGTGDQGLCFPWAIPFPHSKMLMLTYYEA